MQHHSDMFSDVLLAKAFVKFIHDSYFVVLYKYMVEV